MASYTAADYAHQGDDPECGSGDWFQGYSDATALTYDVIDWPPYLDGFVVGGFWSTESNLADTGFGQYPIVMIYDTKTPTSGPIFIMRFLFNMGGIAIEGV